MKNNRNTLLLISGIGHIVKSIFNALALVLVSLCVEMIDVSLKISIFRSKLYAYSPELGEKLITLVVVAIFVYLSLNMFLSFAMGLVCIDQSKLGSNPLTARGAIITLATINTLLLNGIVFNGLAIASLVVDKNQPDGVKLEQSDDNLKYKINELKKLKEEKVISQKEFIELVTKLLVE